MVLALFCTGAEAISVVGDDILAIKCFQNDQNRKANMKFTCCRKANILYLLSSEVLSGHLIRVTTAATLAPSEYFYQSSHGLHRPRCSGCFVSCDPGNDHVNGRLPAKMLYNTMSYHCPILRCLRVVHVLSLHGILAAARLYRPAIFGICSAVNSPKSEKGKH
jgi:hypothetical protein